MWTHFWDKHSGGGLKEPPYNNIFIEADRETAENVFFNRFEHHPSRISCTCYGNDYAIYEDESLEQLTAYQRNCRWGEPMIDEEALMLECKDRNEFIKKRSEIWNQGRYFEPYESLPEGWEIPYELTVFGGAWGPDGYVTLLEYINREDVLVIRESEIKSVEILPPNKPKGGWVWQHEDGSLHRED